MTIAEKSAEKSLRLKAMELALKVVKGQGLSCFMSTYEYILKQLKVERL